MIQMRCPEKKIKKKKKNLPLSKMLHSFTVPLDNYKFNPSPPSHQQYIIYSALSYSSIFSFKTTIPALFLNARIYV